MKSLVVVATFLFGQFAFASANIDTIAGLNLLNGAKVSARGLMENKRGLVVIFLSDKCPCSNSHTAMIKDVVNQNPNYAFLGVHSNVDEPENDAKTYFQQKAFSFPIIQDEKAHLADELKALKTPHVFVLNPHGDVLYEGGVSDSHIAENAKKTFLADALKDIESGKAPRVKIGRTLGCVITR